MSERKSSRSRKAVKYAGFDDESDDDFADAKPSKSKKLKTKEDEDKKKCKERLMESNTGGSLPSNEPSSITKRKSLTDKIYEKELEEALQLSILETSASESPMRTNPEISSSSSPSSANNLQVEVEVTYSKAPELTKVDEENLHLDIKSCEDFDKEPPPLLPLDTSKIGTVMDDSIECVTDKEEEPNNGRRRQRKAAQRPVIIDDDNSGGESDFNPGDNSDSDSNEDDEDEGDEEFSPEEEDSDFDDRQKKKGKENRKNAPATKEKPNSSPKENEPAKAKGAAQKNVGKATEMQDTKRAAANRKSRGSTTFKKDSHPVLKSTQVLSTLSSTTKTTTPTPAVSFKSKISGSSPPVASIQRSTESLSKSWKAPGPANKDKNTSPAMVRSPSSGLRLGLSRNQRVKSLHSSVRVV